MVETMIKHFENQQNSEEIATSTAAQTCPKFLPGGSGSFFEARQLTRALDKHSQMENRDADFKGPLSPKCNVLGQWLK